MLLWILFVFGFICFVNPPTFNFKNPAHFLRLLGGTLVSYVMLQVCLHISK
jgi:hypothetical protein